MLLKRSSRDRYYCRSADAMSSSVSFGLNSDIRSAIFRHSSRVAIAACRFSW